MPAERLQQAMSDYVQKQLAPYLQQAMDQVMKAISERIASTVSSQPKAGAAGGALWTGGGDADVFGLETRRAPCVWMRVPLLVPSISNMDAEDLGSLRMSYAKASKLTYDNNLTTLGYAG